MEFHENRTARPATFRQIRRLVAGLLQLYIQWRLVQQTRRILTHLNDNQLKDIGMTREEVRRYR